MSTPLVDVPPDGGAARRVLASLTRLEREIVELRYTQRLDATERVREALRRLGDGGSPQEILVRAAEELGGCTGLERVLASRVRGGELTALALWEQDPLAGERATLEALRAQPVVLRAATYEAEVLARPQTLIVDVARSGPRAAPRLAELLGWRSYVLAAITLRGETVGLLHGDRSSEARPLVEFDRELVDLFAGGLANVLERALLEQTLQRHRAELGSAARFLARWLGASSAQPAAAPPVAADPRPADPLTARELEVLRLLAQGHTNRAIAGRLVIGEGTVKYHVKNILRKLRARSRAEAVARYLGARPADGPR